ncbi:hypothetical protein VM98_34105, partial [Streptomyces rubellomurinus subsp. indigoferus]
EQPQLGCRGEQFVEVRGSAQLGGADRAVEVARGVTSGAQPEPCRDVAGGTDGRPGGGGAGQRGRRRRDAADGVAGVVSLLDAPGERGLLQAMADAGVDAPLWCGTRGAVSVGAGDRVTSPEQAQLWG